MEEDFFQILFSKLGGIQRVLEDLFKRSATPVNVETPPPKKFIVTNKEYSPPQLRNSAKKVYIHIY